MLGMSTIVPESGDRCGQRIIIIVLFLIAFTSAGCFAPVILGELASVGVEAAKAPGLKSKSRFAIGQRYKISVPTALKLRSKNDYYLDPFRPSPAPDAYEVYRRDPSEFPEVLVATAEPFHVCITKISRSFAGDGWDLEFRAVVEDGPFAGKIVNLFLFVSNDGFGPNPGKLSLIEPN
jgi:hypothetical protein